MGRGKLYVTVGDVLFYVRYIRRQLLRHAAGNHQLVAHVRIPACCIAQRQLT